MTSLPSRVRLGNTAGGVELGGAAEVGDGEMPVLVGSGEDGLGGEPEQETARRARAAKMRLTRVMIPRGGRLGILA
jgi:hypothetical protein